MEIKRAWLILAVICLVFSAPLHAQQPCAPPALTASREPNIFSELQETDLGDAIAEHVQSNYRIIENEELTAYLGRIGDRLSRHLPPTNLRLKLFLIDLPSANAFVLPGGRIFVSRKMVAISEDEDELAGVLSHEIGHLVARHGTIEFSRQLKEAIGVTAVSDRADIFAKYNQLVENVNRRPGAFRRRDGHENQDQIAADRIGLFAAASAGYDPSGQIRLMDRLFEGSKDSGGFFSVLFGTSNPETKRLQELIRTVGTLPASCIDARSKGAGQEFREWQAAVLTYTGASRKEALGPVISRTVLDPPLRGEIMHTRFSPDGRRLIAQDESGINVLSRDPFAVLFRIPAPDASLARFTPDGSTIVFYNSDFRVEMWSAANGKLQEAHELVLNSPCVQTALSPDGRKLACLNFDLALTLFDVGSSRILLQRKDFYAPTFATWFEGMANQLEAISGLESENATWVSMGFSPDGRYFAAGTEGRSETGILFDLQSMTLVSLKDAFRKVLARGFLFTGPDRLIAINPDNPANSSMVSVPQGELVSRVAVAEGRLTPVTSGNYILIRPFQKHPVGVLDFSKGEVFKISESPALDFHGDVFVAERLTGELGLYSAQGNQLRGAVQLPSNPLGTLEGAAVSPNFQWLAVSERVRGAVWNLSTGKQSALIQGFNGGHFNSEGVLIADLPEYRDAGRRLVRVDFSAGGPMSSRELGDDKVQQFGKLLLTIRPTRGSILENAILEASDAATSITQWRRTFPLEMPRVWAAHDQESLVLGWPVVARAAQEAIRNDPALAQRMKTMKEKEGDYLLEVLDPLSGKTRGRLLVETGKGSFNIRQVFAVEDGVVVTDSENRVLVYSLRSGETRGRVFGGWAAASAASGLLCVENEAGHLTLYDLQTLAKLKEYSFTSPVALGQFSPDGKSLFVLTAEQTAYVLGVSP